MNWQSVAGQLAQLGFPMLGRVLGGSIPVVGGMFGGEGGLGEQAGRVVANAISKALGVPPTPEAISAAIENGNTTEVVARLQGIQAEAVARWPALADMAEADASAQVELIKASSAAYETRIRADVATNGFWLSLYRPILNYAATINLILIGIGITWAVYVGGTLMTNLVAAQNLVMAWVGVLGAIVGVHWYTRGKEREAALTTAPVVAAPSPAIAAATAATAAAVATKAVVTAKR